MTGPHCYRLRELLERLQLPRSVFYRELKAGRLPFVQELQPRMGRAARYKVEPVDRYLAGEWFQSRTFTSHRRAG